MVVCDSYPSSRFIKKQQMGSEFELSLESHVTRFPCGPAEETSLRRLDTTLMLIRMLASFSKPQTDGISADNTFI